MNIDKKTCNKCKGSGLILKEKPFYCEKCEKSCPKLISCMYCENADKSLYKDCDICYGLGTIYNNNKN